MCVTEGLYNVHVSISSDHHAPCTQEERAHNTTMKSELSVLEGVLERSGDQAKGELLTLKQMFEQSEQSRTTCEFF